MKVKMRTLYAGPHGTYHPGQVADFALHIAQDLVNGGFATAVDPLPKPDEIKQTPKQPERKRP